MITALKRKLGLDAAYSAERETRSSRRTAAIMDECRAAIEADSVRRREKRYEQYRALYAKGFVDGWKEAGGDLTSEFEELLDAKLAKINP